MHACVSSRLIHGCCLSAIPFPLPQTWLPAAQIWTCCNKQAVGNGGLASFPPFFVHLSSPRIFVHRPEYECFRCLLLSLDSHILVLDRPLYKFHRRTLFVITSFYLWNMIGTLKADATNQDVSLTGMATRPRPGQTVYQIPQNPGSRCIPILVTLSLPVRRPNIRYISSHANRRS